MYFAAAAFWTAWKILEAMKRKKKRFKFRDMEQREVHVINSPEEWEKLYPVLKEQCDTIKVSL